MQGLVPEGEYALIASSDLTRLTGRTHEQLLAQPGVEELVRVYADGRREVTLRVPADQLNPVLAQAQVVPTSLSLPRAQLRRPS